MKKSIILFLLLLELTGCSRTINSWRDNHPEEYYGLLGDDTLPQTLADRNLTFSCKDMIYSSVGHTKKCYVKRSRAQNIDSWGEKILTTSLTAVGETLENIVIVGFYVIAGAIQAKGQ